MDLQLACFWAVITRGMGIMTRLQKSGPMSNVLSNKTQDIGDDSDCAVEWLSNTMAAAIG